MAFIGKNTVKSMIIINYQILQQATYFKYLVCNISCKHDNVTREKLQALQVMYGTLNRVFKNETWIYTKLKFFKVIATPVAMYGRESFVTKQQDKSRIQLAEMKFLRNVKGFSPPPPLFPWIPSDTLLFPQAVYSCRRKVLG
jgi:hypothetical protein